MRRIAALMVLLHVAVGCSTEPNFVEKLATTSSSEASSAIEAARDRWKQAGITSYRYTIELGCPMGCGPNGARATIDVRNGSAFIFSAIDSTDSAGLRSQLFHPMERWFDRLVDGSTSFDDLGLVKVTFDPVTGIPLSATVDPGRGAFDDEFGFAISEFERID